MKELENVKKIYEKEGFDNEKLPKALMQLREVYKAQGDPTLTKVCRLAAEHIAENEGFLVELELDEEEGEAPIEDHFAYFLSLLNEPNNKFNREEIQEYKKLLWDDLGY
jgi:hypothetical protein